MTQRTVEELKKRQKMLFRMQVDLKDYPKSAEEKKIIARMLKVELHDIHEELSKRIRAGERK